MATFLNFIKYIDDMLKGVNKATREKYNTYRTSHKISSLDLNSNHGQVNTFKISCDDSDIMKN